MFIFWRSLFCRRTLALGAVLVSFLLVGSPAPADPQCMAAQPSPLVDPAHATIDLYQQIANSKDHVVEETFIIKSVGMVLLKQEFCQSKTMAVMINIDGNFVAASARDTRINKALALLKQIPVRPGSALPDFLAKTTNWTNFKVLKEKVSATEFGVLIQDSSAKISMLIVEADIEVGTQIQIIIDLAN